MKKLYLFTICMISGLNLTASSPSFDFSSMTHELSDLYNDDEFGTAPDYKAESYNILPYDEAEYDAAPYGHDFNNRFDDATDNEFSISPSSKNSDNEFNNYFTESMNTTRASSPNTMVKKRTKVEQRKRDLNKKRDAERKARSQKTNLRNSWQNQDEENLMITN